MAVPKSADLNLSRHLGNSNLQLFPPTCLYACLLLQAFLIGIRSAFRYVEHFCLLPTWGFSSTLYVFPKSHVEKHTLLKSLPSSSNARVALKKYLQQQLLARFELVPPLRHLSLVWLALSSIVQVAPSTLLQVWAFGLILRNHYSSKDFLLKTQVSCASISRACHFRTQLHLLKLVSIQFQQLQRSSVFFSSKLG